MQCTARLNISLFHVLISQTTNWCTFETAHVEVEVLLSDFEAKVHLKTSGSTIPENNAASYGF